ncbi:MAG: hypothetical protein HUU10_03415 [Bacteroidetes bacterium]|nr:hypothetical protein [Bacteroidota bacterium]
MVSKFRVLFLSVLMAVAALLQAQDIPETQLSAMAEHYYSQKNFTDALELYRQLTSRSPDNDYYFDRYWMCLTELGDYNRAWSALDGRFRRTGNPDYLEDMGRLSMLLGKQERAWNEWQQLIKAYQEDPSVIRSVGSVLSGLKRYDLAKRLFQAYRTREDPAAYAVELFNFAVLAWRAEDAAKEGLLLLRHRPETESMIESRLSTVFGDSAAIEPVIKVWLTESPVHQTPAWWRLAGNWNRLAGRYKEAYTCMATADRKMMSKGQLSWSLISQLRSAEDLAIIIQLSENFRTDFPDSPFRQQVDLKLAGSWLESGPVTPEILKRIEVLYKSQSAGDTGKFLEIWLQAVLRTSWSVKRKADVLDSLLAANKSRDRFYWDWVRRVLRDDWPGALQIFANPVFRNQFRWEYVMNSLSVGVPADTLKTLLFAWARDLKNPDTQQYLYLLVQTVPVPVIDMAQFGGVAKGLIMNDVFQKEEARLQFIRSRELATDPQVKAIAWKELWNTDLALKDASQVDTHLRTLQEMKEIPPFVDDPLFQTAVWYSQTGRIDEAVSILTWMIANVPGSSRIPQARTLLDEIRKGRVS